MGGVVRGVADRMHLVVANEAVATHGVLFIEKGPHISSCSAPALGSSVTTKLSHHVDLDAVVVNEANAVN